MKPTRLVLGLGSGIAAAWIVGSSVRRRRLEARAARDGLTTVPKVELTAYLGLWHELYRIENRWERGCVRATAEYGLNLDGTIRVVNTCHRWNGTRRSFEGKAWVTEPESGARLKVGFLHIGDWYPRIARGDYWILDIGPKNMDGLHSYAVIGEPGRRYGWILARERMLADDTLEGIFERLEAKGYDRNRFRRPVIIRPDAMPASEAPRLNATGAP